MTSCIEADCLNPSHAQGLCPTHYGRARRDGRIAPRPKRSVEERFMSHVRIDDVGCWIWTARLGTGGYGYFGQKVDSVWKQRRAHRVSYELHVGPIPDGLTIEHLCGVPACVNPEHLTPMERVENSMRGTGPAAMNARATECLRGHPLSGDNLQLIRTG